jgi:hypothetical protein
MSTKSFFSRFVFVFVALIVALSALSAVNGCATYRNHSAVVNLVVSQAALRYIEQAEPAKRLERAHKVAEVVERVSSVVKDESVTVADLASVALAALPETLSPADRQLALALIQIAAQELTNRVGTTAIDAETVTSVRSVLDSIRNAADIYTR